VALRRPAALAIALLLGGFALLLAAPLASADALFPEAGGSPNANETRELYLIIFAMAVVVFIGVEGVLFYCLYRYRARRGAVAAQIHGNTRLEVGWTVAATLILVFLTAVTFIKLPSIRNPDGGAPGANAASPGVQYASTDQPPAARSANALKIRVDGQQYLWRYQYPGRERVFSYVDMWVPVGRTVELEITSDDVQHSWWIPELGGKMDALPGYTNRLWFRALHADTFEGQCAELCGRNHANMIARVKAVPQEEYDRWYRDKVADIEADRRAAAQQRNRLEAQQGEEATQQGGGGEPSGATQE